MNNTNLSGAYGSLASSLHMLYHRMPSPDPRRLRVITDAVAADDRALQSLGQDDDPLETKLLKLSGRVAALDYQDHAAFDALLAEVEAIVAD
jgi:hypothetical protein